MRVRPCSGIKILLIIFILNFGVLAIVRSASCLNQQKSPYALSAGFTQIEGAGKLSKIRGIFWSISQSRLLVTDTGNNRLLFFGDKEGRFTFLSEFKPEKMSMPISAVETRQGKIIVIEQGNTISYDPKTGERLSVLNSGFPDSSSFYPVRLALDDKDNLYVTDQGNNRIYVFDSNFAYKYHISSSATQSGGFSAAKIDRFGNIFAIEPVHGLVYVYANGGKLVRQFGKRGNGRAETEFLSDIAVDQQGGVYLVDSHAHRISLFDKNGVWQGILGEKGWKEENMIFPSQIEIDPDYRLFLVDTDDSRLKVFTPAQRSR